jgi:hypothetical protein
MTGATANIPCSQIVDQPTAGIRLERPGEEASKSCRAPIVGNRRIRRKGLSEYALSSGRAAATCSLARN